MRIKASYMNSELLKSVYTAALLYSHTTHPTLQQRRKNQEIIFILKNVTVWSKEEFTEAVSSYFWAQKLNLKYLNILKLRKYT